MISASKRLQKEYQDVKKILSSSSSSSSSDEIIKLEPNPENIMQWTATIKGPKDSFYEGFSFELIINVPSNYPLVPPVIRFKTKIFHPNVLFEVSEKYFLSSVPLRPSRFCFFSFFCYQYRMVKYVLTF
jgi:ubiquitin-protein ligase